MTRRRLTIREEAWPLAQAFTISRGSKTEAQVVTVTIEENGAVGRGECVPYARYGETVQGALAALEGARDAIESGLTRERVAEVLEPKAARNALDCALWDLEAKRSGLPVWRLAGLPEPKALVTAYTLSLDDPARMAEAATRENRRPLLKLKLGRPGDRERLIAVRKAAPKSRLILDANEGWAEADLPGLFAVSAELGVELIEQPLPACADRALARIPHPVPVGADESAHGADTLGELEGLYDAVNIKLDKTGGLTGALAMAGAARARGFRLMVGCMVATSLAMAPAVLLAQGAEVVDLDGPLLLAKDREPGIRYEGSLIHPPPRVLWG